MTRDILIETIAVGLVDGDFCSYEEARTYAVREFCSNSIFNMRVKRICQCLEHRFNLEPISDSQIERNRITIEIRDVMTVAALERKQDREKNE